MDRRRLKPPWFTNSITDNRYPLILCDQMLDFVADYGFSQLVQHPTRNNNILDIFLTYQPSFVESCDVIPGRSDHEIVSVTSITSISHSKPEPRNIILWHKADFEAINTLVAQFSDTFFNMYNHNTSVNVLWDEFKLYVDHVLT